MPALLPEPAVPASYDVALWFLERARAADGHLPAQKLQNLLYLAAIHYEHINAGRPLAPFAFVANDITVVDPNLYRLLEDGRPTLRAEPVPATIDIFLAEIWGRYGHATVERLNAVVRRSLDNDGGLSVDAAQAATEVSPGRRPGQEMPVLEEPLLAASAAVRPTHLGRQVAITPWRPPSAPKKS